MPRRIALVALLGAFVCLGSTAEAQSKKKTKWEFFPEGTVFLSGGGASNPFLADETDNSVAEGHADLSLDLRWRKKLKGRRYSEVLFGGAVFETKQDFNTELEPSASSFRLSLDRDLPVRSRKFMKRLTVGVLVDRASTDFGVLEYGNSTRIMPAVMLTQKTNRIQGVDGPCELGTTILYYEFEDFNDQQNEGDPVFDRTDDGGYESVGIEQSWVFGNVGKKCERTGVFRHNLVYRKPNIRFGFRYRREPTRGSDFGARRRIFDIGGQVPLQVNTDPAFDWRAVASLASYSQPVGSSHRRDESLEGRVGLRWATQPKKMWVRHFDVVASLFGERRDSDIDDFDYDRWGVSIGLDMRFGKRDTGMINVGSSRVEDREPSGGSDPKTKKEIGG